jgi:hypothetical protein
LSESCTFRAAAVILDLGAPQRLSVRFASLRDREVVFDVDSAPESATLRPLAACCVAFSHRGRAMTFLSHVRRIETGAQLDRPRQMTLRIPTQIASEDLRSAYRVNNTRASGLAVKLTTADERVWEPEVVNLSMSGALIQFTDDFPQLSVDTEVALVLSMEGREIELCGTLRRSEGPRWGLTFRESLRGGDIEPPERLAAIVRTLERRWMQQRDSVAATTPAALGS